MDDQNYILFEAYLSKEMSKDEMANFEFRLENEPDFSEAFHIYKELSHFLEHKFENEAASRSFQNNLEKISEAHFNEDVKTTDFKAPSKTRYLIRYLVAACIVLLFGLFILNPFSNPAYSDYMAYDPISLTVRGNNNALLQTAENAFNNKDFAKAQKAFETLLANDASNKALQLYNGLALLELNKFNKADKVFKQLFEGDSAYKNKARWYFALSQLKQKKLEACLKMLQQIPEDADDYKHAQKLIKALD